MKNNGKFAAALYSLVAVFVALVGFAVYSQPSAANSQLMATTTAHEVVANTTTHDTALLADSHAATSESQEFLATSDKEGCLACHDGIEDFAADGSAMAAQYKAIGNAAGDAEGCVVCHGGNPAATTAEEAHMGAPDMLKNGAGPKMFYPDPGNNWIAENTCGQCHPGYAERLTKSLMNTEAGKLQGNLWSWGIQQDRKVVWGNYSMTDENGQTPDIGTDEYKEYMLAMAKDHPDQYPTELTQVPEVVVEEIPDHPNMAGITYSRQQCQRCHVGVTGREKRGDYRGTGCSACHVPYSNEGFYEGNDPTIPRDVPGKLLVHSRQATRESVVTVGDVSYSGIPTESCNTCHNRGKRIGVSYQGIMEFPYGSPYEPIGQKQPKLHTKKYLFIKDDLHHQIQSREGNPEGGLLCQDCHTSIDMHGDGNIFGTTLSQVEIECEDCHGTVAEFPWELPLGYAEEFDKDLSANPDRGLADKLPSFMVNGTVYDKKDGYLLTARGNPFGNVVLDGKKVILHSASGLDFEIPVLKQLDLDDNWKSQDAKVAMSKVSAHVEELECYACHADWAPQCYGCHVTVDYSEGKTDVDWINNASAGRAAANGLGPDNELGTNGLTSAGKVSETRSYLRWETPILGINGEGRVTPLMPGCQVITTVIDKDGNVVAENEIWHTPEGKGLDHAAVQPHTAGRQARTCESCHDNPKTLGYGIEDGRFMLGYENGFVVGLQTATGENIASSARFQSQPIPQLDHDLSQIITRDGKQLVSIGSHWDLTGPLTQDQRDRMERTGLCMGCHQNMADEDFWAKVSTPGFVTNQEHQDLMDKLLHIYEENGGSGQ